MLPARSAFVTVPSWILTLLTALFARSAFATLPFTILLEFTELPAMSARATVPLEILALVTALLANSEFPTALGPMSAALMQLLQFRPPFATMPPEKVDVPAILTPPLKSPPWLMDSESPASW